MSTRIKLMPDYGCWPLWLTDGSGVGNIDPETLPLSAHLRRRLEAWSRRYDETLDEADPASSGFESVEAMDEFRAEGGALRDALTSELGHRWEVVYVCNIGLGEAGR